MRISLANFCVTTIITAKAIVKIRLKRLSITRGMLMLPSNRDETQEHVAIFGKTRNKVLDSCCIRGKTKGRGKKQTASAHQ